MDARGPVSFAQYLRWRTTLNDPAVEVDFSHSALSDADVERMRGPLDDALAAMQRLEAGAIANVDENRMVGHYWLRAPGLAPEDEMAEAVKATMRDVTQLAQRIGSGRISPPEGGAFEKVVVVGIGGSALGPMLLVDALADLSDGLPVHFLDNTDPDGIDRLLGRLDSLQDVLIVVISKSGGTKETRNGMLELAQACQEQGLSFPARAVAVSGEGSRLWSLARDEGWLLTLPMWDWVGGRTSLWSAVGLLPAALAGMDLTGLLAGAAAMDQATRASDVTANPAAMLALFWHAQGNGRGDRAVVVLPYRDRLLLLSRYLQQLVMESLGKRRDRKGKEVLQGLTVYGNKGSTDQHAFVQQLRDGRHDFCVLFLRVLRDRAGDSVFEVEDGATSGDFLDGFLQGTRQALWESGRDSVTITLDAIDERSIGALLALFERAVGLYAELIDVNAYDQPGVEAGKQAAGVVLERQRKLLAGLDETPRTCEELAGLVGGDAAALWPILQHLVMNRPDIHGDGEVDPQRVRFRRRPL